MTVSDLAPRAVVVGLVAFGVWPAVCQFLSNDKPKPPEKMPELAAEMLSPKLPPLPMRDPFGVSIRTKPSTAQKSGQPNRGTGQSPRSSLASNKKASASANKTVGKPVDPLAGFTLSATCIMGDQRLAVINGRLYAPQQTLLPNQPATNKPGTNKSATDKLLTNKSAANQAAIDKAAADEAAAAAYQVVDVLPYKVLLAHDGHILELVYSNVASGPGGGSKAGEKGKKARGSSGKSGGSKARK
jgi:hypothetical protein